MELFDWAKYRQTKGVVKLHLLLDHDGYLPVFAHITVGYVHEVNVARDLTFPSGSIMAIGRVYWNYALLSHWTDDGVYFMARIKSNAVYDVIDERPVPQGRNILRDCMIRQRLERCLHGLRLVEVWEAKNYQVITLRSNHLEFGATTIADVYRDCWQIKIFFKTIKQNLKIKIFVCTSPNALPPRFGQH